MPSQNISVIFSIVGSTANTGTRIQTGFTARARESGMLRGLAGSVAANE